MGLLALIIGKRMGMGFAYTHFDLPTAVSEQHVHKLTLQPRELMNNSAV
jgi:hypothetical protein